MLRKIFKPSRDEVMEYKRKLLNDEFHNLYSQFNIIRVFLSRSVIYAGHSLRMEWMRNAFTILVLRCKGTRPLERWRQGGRMMLDGSWRSGMWTCSVGSPSPVEDAVSSVCEHSSESSGFSKPSSHYKFFKEDVEQRSCLLNARVAFLYTRSTSIFAENGDSSILLRSFQ
jgi:hypothetical protein